MAESAQLPVQMAEDGPICEFQESWFDDESEQPSPPLPQAAKDLCENIANSSRAINSALGQRCGTDLEQEDLSSDQEVIHLWEQDEGRSFIRESLITSPRDPDLAHERQEHPPSPCRELSMTQNEINDDLSVVADLPVNDQPTWNRVGTNDPALLGPTHHQDEFVGNISDWVNDSIEGSPISTEPLSPSDEFPEMPGSQHGEFQQAQNDLSSTASIPVVSRVFAHIFLQGTRLIPGAEYLTDVAKFSEAGYRGYEQYLNVDAQTEPSQLPSEDEEPIDQPATLDVPGSPSTALDDAQFHRACQIYLAWLQNRDPNGPSSFAGATPSYTEEEFEWARIVLSDEVKDWLEYRNIRMIKNDREQSSLEPEENITTSGAENSTQSVSELNTQANASYESFSHQEDTDDLIEDSDWSETGCTMSDLDDIAQSMHEPFGEVDAFYESPSGQEVIDDWIEDSDQPDTDLTMSDLDDVAESVQEPIVKANESNVFDSYNEESDDSMEGSDQPENDLTMSDLDDVAESVQEPIVEADASNEFDRYHEESDDSMEGSDEPETDFTVSDLDVIAESVQEAFEEPNAGNELPPQSEKRVNSTEDFCLLSSDFVMPAPEDSPRSGSERIAESHVLEISRSYYKTSTGGPTVPDHEDTYYTSQVARIEAARSRLTADGQSIPGLLNWSPFHEDFGFDIVPDVSYTEFGFALALNGSHTDLDGQEANTKPIEDISENTVQTISTSDLITVSPDSIAASPLSDLRASSPTSDLVAVSPNPPESDLIASSPTSNLITSSLTSDLIVVSPNPPTSDLIASSPSGLMAASPTTDSMVGSPGPPSSDSSLSILSDSQFLEMSDSGLEPSATLEGNLPSNEPFPPLPSDGGSESSELSELSDVDEDNMTAGHTNKPHANLGPGRVHPAGQKIIVSCGKIVHKTPTSPTSPISTLTSLSLSCKKCGRKYTKGLFLQRHEENCLAIPANVGNPNSGIPSTRFAVPIPSEHARRNSRGFCESCDKDFSTITLLKDHINGACPVLRDAGVYEQLRLFNLGRRPAGAGGVVASTSAGVGRLPSDSEAQGVQLGKRSRASSRVAESSAATEAPASKRSKRGD